jgi:hypothetical protein
MNNDDTRRLTMDGKASGYSGPIYSGLKLRSSNDDFSDRPWRTVDHQEGDRVFYVKGGWDSVSTLRMFRVAFDAPDVTAKPGDRPLAPGWIEPEGRRECSRCGVSAGRQFYRSAGLLSATACERCAPHLGVFADAPKAEPSKSIMPCENAIPMVRHKRTDHCRDGPEELVHGYRRHR